MRIALRGYQIALLLALATILAYAVLATRLPANVAFAFSLFGGCVAALFLFAVRMAKRETHHHD